MSINCPLEILGDERCPGFGDVVAYHTQIQLNGSLEIPAHKPPMEDIFDVTHTITVTKFTPVIVKKPPGKKILVVGNVRVGIEYIAKVPDQKIHFAHWDVPFQALIKNDDGSLLPLDFDISKYVLHICVEEEDYTKADERHVTKQLVLLVWLQLREN